MMERVKEVIRIACEECCLEPTISVSLLAFAGSQGVYSMINAASGGILIQACIPEELPDVDMPVWDGNVVVSSNKDNAVGVPITKLIDAIQTFLDSARKQ